MLDIFQGIVDWSIQFLQHYGLWAIFVLMLLETGMILHGVPSELIMTVGTLAVVPDQDPAARLLAVIFVGTIGAAIGSMIPYWAALYGGRPFILKHKRFFHMDEAKLDRLEGVFRRPSGAFLVFACRLLPFLRAFVSIPAGLARMNVWLFTFLSTIGALLFNFVLAYGAYLTARRPDSGPAKAYKGLEAWFIDHWIAITIVAVVLIITLLIAWPRRQHVARHYNRLMPRGWEGAVVAACLVVLIFIALFLAAPAAFRGFVRGSQQELVQAGQAESTTPWLGPLLILSSLIVLLFFIAAVRHEFAYVLSRMAGKGEHRNGDGTGADPPAKPDKPDRPT
ncbi:MAG: DedA family protein [bacterium]